MSDPAGIGSLSSAPPLGVTKVSIQHRCPMLNFHHDQVHALPIPCDQCYSVAVTSVSIPYRPDVRWLEVTTRTTDG